MKNRRLCAVCIVLLPAVFASSCDGLYGSQPGNVKAFSNDLRGKWVSNETGLYSGTLIIDFDTIIIEGYGEDYWTTVLGDDNMRPFRDFPKGVTLKGHSEDGKIFIEYGGSAQDGIPYIYTLSEDYPNKIKLLEFTFGGRKEKVQCTAGS
jgi:hypothetical protein